MHGLPARGVAVGLRRLAVPALEGAREVQRVVEADAARDLARAGFRLVEQRTSMLDTFGVFVAVEAEGVLPRVRARPGASAGAGAGWVWASWSRRCAGRRVPRGERS